MRRFLQSSVPIIISAVLATVVASAGTIPAGTTLVVSTMGSVSTKDRVGKEFSVQLDQDVKVKGAVVARAGTKFIGKVETSTKIGNSPLTVNLTRASANGRMVPVKTTGAYKPQSVSRGRKTQVKTRDFVLPPGSKMQFQLAQPVTI
jgi:hypothetical protein